MSFCLQGGIKYYFWVFVLSENVDPHTSQEYDFSPECFYKCLLKVEPNENADADNIQEYAFPCVCFHICVFKFELQENVDSHISQE